MAHVVRGNNGERDTPPVGERVARLSRRQGGAVAHAQLVAPGVDHDRIQRFAAHGWLARVHRGIYRVGARTPDGELWAAFLACGPRAALSHRTAAHEHSVMRGDRPRVVDVTAPTRRRPG